MAAGKITCTGCKQETAVGGYIAGKPYCQSCYALGRWVVAEYAEELNRFGDSFSWYTRRLEIANAGEGELVVKKTLDVD